MEGFFYGIAPLNPKSRSAILQTRKTYTLAYRSYILLIINRRTFQQLKELVQLRHDYNLGSSIFTTTFRR